MTKSSLGQKMNIIFSAGFYCGHLGGRQRLKISEERIISLYNELIKLQTDAGNAFDNMKISEKVFIRKLGEKIREVAGQ